MIKAKHAYEPPAPEDGERFLVDRLWPRGVRGGGRRCKLTAGFGRWRPATRSGSGSATTPPSGQWH